MKITVAHLYYDLLNLYGESGNIKIIKKALESQGIEVNVELLSVGDELNFKNYDFVYMGQCVYENLLIVNSHLKKYTKDIKKYIDSGKVILCTGNSYELFGKSIRFKLGKMYTLGIFNFTSKELDKRKVLEVNAQTKYINNNIIGFMNTRSFNNNKTNSFLTIKENDNSFKEGILYNNFIGTYTIGPILVRNPELLKKIVTSIILKKKKNFKFKEFDFEFLENAYKDCLKRRNN